MGYFHSVFSPFWSVWRDYVTILAVNIVIKTSACWCPRMLLTQSFEFNLRFSSIFWQNVNFHKEVKIFKGILKDIQVNNWYIELVALYCSRFLQSHSELKFYFCSFWWMLHNMFSRMMLTNVLCITAWYCYFTKPLYKPNSSTVAWHTQHW